MTARTPVAMVPAMRPTLWGWAAGLGQKRRKVHMHTMNLKPHTVEWSAENKGWLCVIHSDHLKTSKLSTNINALQISKQSLTSGISCCQHSATYLWQTLTDEEASVTVHWQTVQTVWPAVTWTVSLSDWCQMWGQLPSPARLHLVLRLFGCLAFCLDRLFLCHSKRKCFTYAPQPARWADRCSCQ